MDRSQRGGRPGLFIGSQCEGCDRCARLTYLASEDRGVCRNVADVNEDPGVDFVPIIRGLVVAEPDFNRQNV